MPDYQKERLQPKYLVDTHAAFASDFLIGTADAVDDKLNVEITRQPKGGFAYSIFHGFTPRDLILKDPARFRYLNMHEFDASMEAMKEWESTR